MTPIETADFPVSHVSELRGVYPFEGIHLFYVLFLQNRFNRFLHVKVLF